jgi:hypothetical protein
VLLWKEVVVIDVEDFWCKFWELERKLFVKMEKSGFGKFFVKVSACQGITFRVVTSSSLSVSMCYVGLYV